MEQAIKDFYHFSQLEKWYKHLSKEGTYFSFEKIKGIQVRNGDNLDMNNYHWHFFLIRDNPNKYKNKIKLNCHFSNINSEDYSRQLSEFLNLIS